MSKTSLAKSFQPPTDGGTQGAEIISLPPRELTLGEIFNKHAPNGTKSIEQASFTLASREIEQTIFAKLKSTDDIEVQKKLISLYVDQLASIPIKNIGETIHDKLTKFAYWRNAELYTHTLSEIIKKDRDYIPKAIRKRVFGQGASIKMLSSFRQVFPQNQRIVHRLADAYRKTQQIDKAIKVLCTVVDKPNPFMPNIELLVSLYLKKGHYKAAKQTLSPFAGQETPNLTLEKGKLLLAEKKPQQARNILTTAIIQQKMPPRTFSILDNAMKASKASASERIGYLKKGYEQYPENFTIAQKLAEAHIENGDYTLARGIIGGLLQIERYPITKAQSLLVKSFTEAGDQSAASYIGALSEEEVINNFAAQDNTTSRAELTYE